MAGPETVLVNRIRDRILKEYPDAWVRKIHGSPYQQAGIPDLLVCLDGQLFGLEVKAPRAGESRAALERRVTPLQRAEMRKMTAAGAVAAVVTSDSEALSALKGRPDSEGQEIYKACSSKD